MKTMIKYSRLGRGTDDIVRVLNSKVLEYQQRGYVLCPKSEWKKLLETKQEGK